MKNRIYSYGDIAMLMTSQKIAESFIANLVRLATVRTDWTPEYGTELKTRIDSGLEKIGVDPKKDLRAATKALTAIQEPAMEDLALFKTQINGDFKKQASRKKEMLKVLGFTEHLRKVQKGDQEALIQLLYKFKTNMTPALRTEITAKGMMTTFIDQITGYTETLKNADVTQETFKDTSKEVTKEVSDSFNAIYDEVIEICKKGAKIFHKEPLKKAQFTFSKVLKQLGETPKAVKAATLGKKAKV